MQACRGGDVRLGIAVLMADLADGCVSEGTALCASENLFQGRTVGKTLGARDFLEGAFVFEQRVELFQKCILSEQALSLKIIPGRLRIKPCCNKKTVLFPGTRPISAKLFQNPVHRQPSIFASPAVGR